MSLGYLTEYLKEDDRKFLWNYLRRLCDAYIWFSAYGLPSVTTSKCKYMVAKTYRLLPPELREEYKDDNERALRLLSIS